MKGEIEDLRKKLKMYSENTQIMIRSIHYDILWLNQRIDKLEKELNVFPPIPETAKNTDITIDDTYA